MYIYIYTWYHTILIYINIEFQFCVWQAPGEQAPFLVFVCIWCIHSRIPIVDSCWGLPTQRFATPYPMLISPFWNAMFRKCSCCKGTSNEGFNRSRRLKVASLRVVAPKKAVEGHLFFDFVESIRTNEYWNICHLHQFTMIVAPKLEMLDIARHLSQCTPFHSAGKGPVFHWIPLVLPLRGASSAARRVGVWKGFLTWGNSRRPNVVTNFDSNFVGLEKQGLNPWVYCLQSLQSLLMSTDVLLWIYPESNLIARPYERVPPGIPGTWPCGSWQNAGALRALLIWRLRSLQLQGARTIVISLLVLSIHHEAQFKSAPLLEERHTLPLGEPDGLPLEDWDDTHPALQVFPWNLSLDGKTMVSYKIPHKVNPLSSIE